MRKIKYRQAIFKSGKFVRFHYWGFCGYKDEFVGPLTISGINCQYDIKESEQCTGLKDKNEVDIYESDIVGGIGKGYSDDYEVRFGWQGWEIHSEKDVMTLNLTQNSVFAEIIGNIHENQ